GRRPRPGPRRLLSPHVKCLAPFPRIGDGVPVSGSLPSRLRRYQADQRLAAPPLDAEDDVARYRWAAGAFDGEARLGSAYRAGFYFQAVQGVATRRLGTELVAVGGHHRAAAA